MNNEELAVSAFNKGFNCSQAVLTVYSDMFNLDKVTALNIARGFGAGMGRLQGTCGAVTGACMVIGLNLGKPVEKEQDLKEKTYLKIREFTDMFKIKYKTVNCRELLGGCDLLTEEGKMRFKKESLGKKICSECVRYSVRILDGILEEK